MFDQMLELRAGRRGDLLRGRVMDKAGEAAEEVLTGIKNISVPGSAAEEEVVWMG